MRGFGAVFSGTFSARFGRASRICARCSNIILLILSPIYGTFAQYEGVVSGGYYQSYLPNYK